MGKMATDLGKPIGSEIEETDCESTINGNTAENGASNGNGTSSTSAKLTEEQVVVLSEKLSKHWEVLIPKLGLPEEKVDECKQGADDVAICMKLLNGWVEQDGDEATLDEISYMLGSLKLSQLIEGAF